MFELTGDNLTEVEAKRKEHNEKVFRVIERVYSEDTDEKKQQELANAGKFLLSLDETARIVEAGESPDFIVELGGEKFGLENRVIRNSTQPLIGMLNKLVGLANEEIVRRRPDAKILVNVYVKPVWIPKAQQQITAEVIVDYILAIYNKAPSPLPNCLKKILILPDKRGPRLVYNPGVYIQKELTVEELLEAIEDKSRKLPSYRENSGLNNQWLLLVIGETGPASNEVMDFVLTGKIEADFNRIYIFEDYNFTSTRIK